VSQVQVDYEALVTFSNSVTEDQIPKLTGYICNEPLLLQPSYLEQLSAAGIPWLFQRCHPRLSCLCLGKTPRSQSPVLIAMEDAPGKPDPTGLWQRFVNSNSDFLHDRYASSLCWRHCADIYTVQQARLLYPNRYWIGVGILPPHVQETVERRCLCRHSYCGWGSSLVI